MGYVPHDNIPHAQYKLINDPPCWCTGYTEIFDINHVHDKDVWTRKRINKCRIASPVQGVRSNSLYFSSQVINEHTETNAGHEITDYIEKLIMFVLQDSHYTG